MSLPRICWRRSLRLRNPSTPFIRRNTQHAYSPLQEPAAPTGLSLPLLVQDEATQEYLQHNGIRNPNDNPQLTTPLYTPNGLKIAWHDYQSSLVDRLNELTAETPLYGKLPRPVALATARDPLRAAIFNHASMALNNHLYFNGISKNGPTQMPISLAAKIKEDFGSVEILRSEMLAMAYSMFGPGFVWLVRTEQKGDTSSIFSQRKFRLMCTYLAGSPLAGAHNRAQPLDMNTQNVAEAQAAGGLQGLSEQERSRQTNVQNSAGTMGAYAPRKEGVEKTSFGGVHIVPVLGVNTWQHAWLPDHGVGGKMTFLQKWWDLIDWNMVDSISATTVEASKPQFDAFSHGNSGRGNSANFHHS